jgi:hypothetical protein
MGQNESIAAPEAPTSAEPSSAHPTDKEFKERFPGAEKQKEIPTTRLHPCSDGKTRNDEQYEIYKKF